MWVLQTKPQFPGITNAFNWWVISRNLLLYFLRQGLSWTWIHSELSLALSTGIPMSISTLGSDAGVADLNSILHARMESSFLTEASPQPLSLFFFKVFIHLLLGAWMFGLGEHLYTTRLQCLWRSEEGIGTGVTDFYERHVGTEPCSLICRAVPSAQLLFF